MSFRSATVAAPYFDFHVKYDAPADVVLRAYSASGMRASGGTLSVLDVWLSSTDKRQTNRRGAYGSRGLICQRLFPNTVTYANDKLEGHMRSSRSGVVQRLDSG